MRARSASCADALCGTIEWLLPTLLRRRALSAPEFAAMLRAEGYVISDSQVYRLLQHDPQRYEHDLLVAICQTLGCELSDLLQYDRRASDVAALPPAFRIPGT